MPIRKLTELYLAGFYRQLPSEASKLKDLEGLETEALCVAFSCPPVICNL